MQTAYLSSKNIKSILIMYPQSATFYFWVNVFFLDHFVKTIVIDQRLQIAIAQLSAKKK